MSKATPGGNEQLAKAIRDSLNSGKPVDTPLNTDERVLARITDGIYRQPSSALRELIANAYDADATTVSISTDAPRFGTIKVSDNGRGMTAESLAYLITHIGGSAKRIPMGVSLGVTNSKNPSLSVKGRRLIGKIGIGLFSVAQLARQFTIVTKTAGTDYQLLAHVTLHRFDEGELEKQKEDNPARFKAGAVRIWSEKTTDKKGHGTTVHLNALLPRVIHILQSRDIWEAIHDEEASPGRTRRRRPKFHIGEINPNDSSTFLTTPSFPWTSASGPEARFHSLVKGVSEAPEDDRAFNKLEHSVDNYFRMLWDLGLALPIPYVGKHPFGLNGSDVARVFALPDRQAKGSLEETLMGPRQTVGGVMKLPSTEDSSDDFTVLIDGVELARPISFADTITTGQAIEGPIIFAGTAKPDMSKIPEEQRGGDFSFSGYFFWTHKVVPQEHNGLLIRINGASGTLFDSSFLKYQITERRLEQLVAEVFIHTGLEGALNIDRESFNTAHPHYLILTKWVHNSLHLIRNTLKTLQGSDLDRRRKSDNKKKSKALTKLVDNLILEQTSLEPEEIPDIVIVSDDNAAKTAAREGSVALLSSKLNATASLADVRKREWVSQHAIQLARFLEAHGVFNDIGRDQQSKLIGGILAIFDSSNGGGK